MRSRDNVRRAEKGSCTWRRALGWDLGQDRAESWWQLGPRPALMCCSGREEPWWDRLLWPGEVAPVFIRSTDNGLEDRWE